MSGEWLAQVPEDLRTNEALTSHETLGDFVKSHLDTVGKVSEFDGKVTDYEGQIQTLNDQVSNSIPRLTDDSDDEAKAAYYKALGVPETADAYEFPKGEGIEHDESTIAWARQAFHAAKLNPTQASAISQSWDQFIQGMREANDAAIKEGIETADAALKDKWKADYDQNIKETERGFQAFEKAVPGFNDLLNSEVAGVRIGNHPVMAEIFHLIGKSIGDDLSIPSLPAKQENKPGDLRSIYKVQNPK